MTQIARDIASNPKIPATPACSRIASSRIKTLLLPQRYDCNRVTECAYLRDEYIKNLTNKCKLHASDRDAIKNDDLSGSAHTFGEINVR